MSIQGKQRTQQSVENQKLVGLAEVTVLAINPTREELEELLGIELKEDSKATEYLGESRDGNTTLRVNVWVEDVKEKRKLSLSFFLENKVKENKDATKKQYLNTVGITSWADDPNNLPSWFTKREYREAFVGEEELYNFMRTWLGKLDYRDADTVLSLEWKKLMKGDVKDIKSQLNGEFSTPFVVMAEIKTVEKDGETKEYQSVYNRAFLPSYSLKQFRLVDYNKPEEQAKLKVKAPKDLKPHERFVLSISGEYGTKNYYLFKDLQPYDASKNLVSTNNPILTEDSPDY